MSWVIPRVWAVGEENTAAKMNEISAALNDLDRRTVPVGASVAAVESTPSTSYTDLATVGPAVSVVIGSTGKALVGIYSALSNASGNFAIMSFAISGASTASAFDSTSLQTSTTSDIRVGASLLETALNPGATTFTCKYRATAGTAGFNGRRIVATPLGS